MPEAGSIWPEERPEAPAELAVPTEPVFAIATPLLPELAIPALNTGTAEPLVVDSDHEGGPPQGGLVE
eukprot:11703972-Heterocapsa_arctica.AAC.1